MTKKSVAIIGEGETEWFYFESMRILKRYSYQLKPTFPKHSDWRYIFKQARQCIKDVVIIAKYKPELIDVILEALVKYEKIYDDSMQNLIFKDRQKAIRIIRQYTW